VNDTGNRITKTLPNSLGYLANSNRKGIGRLKTHWRIGYPLSTSSTKSAALSAILLAPQLGLADGGKKTSAFATKRDKFLVFTIAACDPKKTVLEATATQKIVKLTFNVVGQVSILLG
jgi:hypothetical protein